LLRGLLHEMQNIWSLVPLTFWIETSCVFVPLAIHLDVVLTLSPGD
jgi:hypothetical protein